MTEQAAKKFVKGSALVMRFSDKDCVWIEPDRIKQFEPDNAPDTPSKACRGPDYEQAW